MESVKENQAGLTIPATTARSSAGRSEKSLQEFVLIFVCADPDPFNAVFNQLSQGAIMVTNANGKAFAATRKFLEVERRMVMIVAPEPVVFTASRGMGLGNFV